MECTCLHPDAQYWPALEHGKACPIKLGFFGGDPSWGVGSEGSLREKADGTLFKWGGPGTWLRAANAPMSDLEERYYKLHMALRAEPGRSKPAADGLPELDI